MKNEVKKNVQAPAYNGACTVHDFHQQKMVARVGAEFTFWLSMSQPTGFNQSTYETRINFAKCGVFQFPDCAKCVEPT